MKVWKIVLLATGVSLVFIVGVVGYLYAFLAAPSLEQYHQLKQLVATHNVVEIKQVSADKETEQFLLGLPKDAKVNGSDFQGGGPAAPGITIGYFPASIDGRSVGTFMSSRTGFHLIPHWKLIKISIKNIAIDPNWVK